MPTDTKLKNLVINYLTKEQYDAISTPNENELYLTSDMSSSGGGGVSPCLNLIDFSGDEPAVRTSITEEEKNNIEKGLYNSVFYADFSSGELGVIATYFSETAASFEGQFMFSTYNISADETSGMMSIPSSSSYILNIGGKSADGTYPITIEKQFDASFGGGSSLPAITAADIGKVLTVTNDQKTAWESVKFSFKDITVSELQNHVGEFGNFHITDLGLVYPDLSDSPAFTGGYFIGTISSSVKLSGIMWFVVDQASNQIAYYSSANFSLNDGKIFDQPVKALGSVKSMSWPNKINSQEGYNLLLSTVDLGEIAYIGQADTGSSDRDLILGLSSTANINAIGDAEFCSFDCIVYGKGIGRMSLKRDSNDIPQFKSFTTWLPPVTASSEDKALIVTGGNAQWTSIQRYRHTVTLKTSAGAILWTQTLSNSKNTPVNSYDSLHSMFGEELLAGYGEYAQLDLRGGTVATDKLIKLDGTEATLSSLGTIVYSDVCFLPK